jgi:signal transduction histidine kinase
VNLYQHFDRYLDQISFSKKTKWFIAIIAIGMISIGFFMLVSIFAIKYDYETLYNKRTFPQTNLENIKDIYTVNIYDTLRDIQNGSVRNPDAIEVMELGRQIIGTEWENYRVAQEENIGGVPRLANRWLNFFLSREISQGEHDYQKGLLAKISIKMDKIDTEIGRIISALKSETSPAVAKAMEKVLLDIPSINIYLSSLIRLNLKEAMTEKERNDTMFHTSIVMLFLLLAFTFFLSILIAGLLANHFKSLNESLESKVAEKTVELRQLNVSLEERITREVEASRKKDRIMFQQARLASMGEMLQNIAHQWRQPLGTLMMIIQSFQSKFLAGKLDEIFIESRVEDATTVAQNMSTTLEDFRTFFHPHKMRTTFSLKLVIEKAIGLSKYQLNKDDIAVLIDIKEDAKIYGYENEMMHILLNLINNARDAFVGKALSLRKILFIVKQTDEAVIVHVIDNAGGIRDDLIAKVFEPYFTTKHKSAGTGVGLYMSKQIIEKHMHGKISCKNIRYKIKPGSKKLYNCAMFTLEIPQIEKKELENEST